jgi:dihydrofolate synthase / folylpolyglutamate synthase
MNYQDTLEYLVEQLPMYQRIGSLAYRTGLENTIKLDEYFKCPHRNFPAIHVAGTNGKGSVSHMMASVLQEAGYSVGLYTSPHLLDFRERIKVNGKLINRKFIIDFVEENKPFFDTFQPSFFEISVFLAFCYFVHCRVDIAVIEVGLGGRLDATNIINPILSIITNIGKDHTAILGDTLAKIAAEKAGIIKRRTPVVVGESHPETLPVFIRQAEEMKAPLVVADSTYHIDSSYLSVDGYQVLKVKRNEALPYPNLKCGLLGHYQRKNTATLLSAIDQLRQAGISLEEKVIYAGIKHVIKNTGLAGRWQITGHEPTTVADTAHNADGLKQVLQQVAETPNDHLHMILGFVNDKDIDAMLALLPANADYYFTRLSVPRTLDEKVLASKASEYGIKGLAYPHVREAYAGLKNKAAPHDLVVITGSTFLVADFLTLINEQNLH